MQHGATSQLLWAPAPIARHASQPAAGQSHQIAHKSLLSSVLNINGPAGADDSLRYMVPGASFLSGTAPAEPQLAGMSATSAMMDMLNKDLGLTTRGMRPMAPSSNSPHTKDQGMRRFVSPNPADRQCFQTQHRQFPVKGVPSGRGSAGGRATGWGSAPPSPPPPPSPPQHSGDTVLARRAPMCISPAPYQAKAMVAAAAKTAELASSRQAFLATEAEPGMSGCSTDRDESDGASDASESMDAASNHYPGAASISSHSSGSGAQSQLLRASSGDLSILQQITGLSARRTQPSSPKGGSSRRLAASPSAGSILDKQSPPGRLPPRPKPAPGLASTVVAYTASHHKFWGGDEMRKASSSRPARSSSAGGNKLSEDNLARLSNADSRPGTASSYWSNYDIEEGALEKAGTVQTAEALKVKLPKRLNSSLRSSTSVGQIRSGLATPTRKQEPYLRYLHPSVIMDLNLLTPNPKPIKEVPEDEKGRPYPYVLPPTFPGAYPTIAFTGPASAKQAAGLHPLLAVKMMVRYAGIANSPVKAAFKEGGWRVTKGKRWSVCWGHIFTAAEFAGIHEFQRVNHFPGTWELGRKDHLYRNVASLRRKKGDVLDIVPRFFIMPRDYEELQADVARHPGRLYIRKPVNSSRGRGIRMVTKPAELPRDCKDVLIQHYIHNPYTINGYKFDMRIYVAVTCVDPLRVYVYEDGLARFATEPYSDDKADLKKRCVHLTNYSLNKKSNKFSQNETTEDESTGSKWSLTALRAHIEKDRGAAAWKHVWAQVNTIIMGGVLAAEPRINTEVKMKVPHRNVCFEVWGFDVLLDDMLRAWLIEVNTCPALAADSPMDKRVKYGMVADVMNLVGPVPYDPEVYEATREATRQARLTGLRAEGSSSSNLAAARAGRAGSGNGGGGGGVQQPPRPGVPQVPRTIREAEELDLAGLPPDQLPDIVIEAEAEYARRRGWQRVFPCPSDPCRYLDLFETPRAANVVLCKYYCQKAGKEFGWSSGAGSRPGSTSHGLSSRGSSRPPTNSWRPGGVS